MNSEDDERTRSIFEFREPLALASGLGRRGRDQCGHAHWQVASSRAGVERRAPGELGASGLFALDDSVCGHVFGLDGRTFCRCDGFEALHAHGPHAVVLGQRAGGDLANASHLALDPVF